jgi:hypothetical protein
MIDVRTVLKYASSMTSEEEVLRRYFSNLGKKKTPAKLASIRAAQKASAAARGVPVATLENAYQAFKSGRVTRTHAAVHMAKTKYSRFVRYCERREAGETPKQIQANP